MDYFAAQNDATHGWASCMSYWHRCTGIALDTAALFVAVETKSLEAKLKASEERIVVHKWRSQMEKTSWVWVWNWLLYRTHAREYLTKCTGYIIMDNMLRPVMFCEEAIMEEDKEDQIIPSPQMYK